MLFDVQQNSGRFPIPDMLWGDERTYEALVENKETCGDMQQKEAKKGKQDSCIFRFDLGFDGVLLHIVKSGSSP
jgi:hypothetical protein